LGLSSTPEKINRKGESELGKKGLIIGYEHRYQDKRVFLKSVLSFSRCFESIFYVVKEERPSGLDVPSNVIDIVVPNLPLRTVKRTLFYDARLRKRILHLEGELDLILIHNLPGLLSLGNFVKALKKKFRCPVIVDLHEFTPEVMLPSLTGKKWGQFLNEKCFFHPFLEMVDGAIVVSPFVKRYLESVRAFAGKPILVVPNFSHFPPINPGIAKKDSGKIGIVGKIHEGFGSSVLNAFCEAALKNPKYSIHFVGSSKQNGKRAGLKQEFVEHPRVFFHGMLPYDEMMRFVSEMFFTFSLYSTWRKNNIIALPNKLFDSITAGTPVVTSIQMKEMANWVQKMGVGLVIDTSKPDWAQEIIPFFESPQNGILLRKNIQKNQKHFHWDSMIDSYQKFFLSFLEETSQKGT